MNKRLKRLLDKLGNPSPSAPPDAERWKQFIGWIDSHYEAADQDRYLLERSLQISSDEMKERWQRINTLLAEARGMNSRLESQNRILREITLNNASVGVFQILLRATAQAFSAAGGMLYQINEPKTALVASAAYGLAEPYASTVATMTIGDGVASCGHAAFHREPCYSADIEADANWDAFRTAVEAASLKACWSIPILAAEGELLGSMAIYFSSPRAPQKWELEALSSNAQIALLAIEKERARQALAREQAKSMAVGKKVAIGEMAGGMAHEINNPLSIITMYLERLEILAGTKSLTAENLGPIIEGAKTTVARIGKIVRALKIYSRDDARGKMEPYDIAAVVEDSMTLCSEKIKMAGIELSLARPKTATVFNCDPIKLSQVFLNLLSNSYDAVLGSANPWIRIAIEAVDDGLRVSVTDSGPGIPPAIREKLMQPFFTTKEVGKGTGIGLSLSLGLVREHGGEIFYDGSCVNTRFVIELPRQKETGSEGIDVRHAG